MHQSLYPRQTENPYYKPLSLRLPHLPYDEKAAFVETVCATLIESRFGRGRSSGLILDFRCRSVPEDDVIFWDTDLGVVPAYLPAPLGRHGRRMALFADQLARGAAHLDNGNSANGHAHSSPSVLGRGSPYIDLCRALFKPPLIILC